jgi:phage N-6-adenine-methyltransferase
MTLLNITNPRHIGYVGAIRASGDEAGDAWATPPKIISLAKEILGGIDLDPFSGEWANSIVGARRIFTTENSAFDQHRWKAKSVWMNPPYSRGLCKKAVGRFMEEFKAGSFPCGLVLVNNMTETNWFWELAGIADRICYLHGRIAFIPKDNKRESGNTRGQTIFLVSPKNHNAVWRFDTLMPTEGRVYGKHIAGVCNA